MKPEYFFQKIKNDLQHIEQQMAQDIVAVEAERFHEMNFRNQGFTDAALTPWPKRKTTIQNTKDFEGGSYELDHKDKGRALLVQTSNLKGRALKGRAQGDSVVFSLPDYGKAHNEGGRAGRGAGFNMPKRQYLGHSQYLDNRIKQKAKQWLDNYMDKL